MREELSTLTALLPEKMFWMKMRETSTEIGQSRQNVSFS
jgi:hypothetical protein